MREWPKKARPAGTEPVTLSCVVTETIGHAPAYHFILLRWGPVFMVQGIACRAGRAESARPLAPGTGPAPRGEEVLGRPGAVGVTAATPDLAVQRRRRGAGS